MGLQNLVGISLEQITPARETIKRLLDAAARHIADAKVNAISAERDPLDARCATVRDSLSRRHSRPMHCGRSLQIASRTGSAPLP